MAERGDINVDNFDHSNNNLNNFDNDNLDSKIATLSSSSVSDYKTIPESKNILTTTSKPGKSVHSRLGQAKAQILRNLETNL
jgi:hypothetical protein